ASRSLKTRNFAFLFKVLSAIQKKEDRSWIRWVNEFYIKGGSIFDPPRKITRSWVLAGLSRLMMRWFTLSTVSRLKVKWIGDNKGDFTVKGAYQCTERGGSLSPPVEIYFVQM
ncbi:hypothetical protein Dimus_037547, partial [Dionaea muscipula]